jgi:hypothetical protein
MSPLQRKPHVFADIEMCVERIRRAPKKGARLSDDDRLFILWAKSKGYSHPEIAKSIEHAPSSVWNYIHQIQQSPLIVFDQKCYDSLEKKKYKCRFCNEIRASEVRMQRHVLAHFIPYEIARDMSLDGIRKSL